MSARQNIHIDEGRFRLRKKHTAYARSLVHLVHISYVIQEANHNQAPTQTHQSTRPAIPDFFSPDSSPAGAEC